MRRHSFGGLTLRKDGGRAGVPVGLWLLASNLAYSLRPGGDQDRVPT